MIFLFTQYQSTPLHSAIENGLTNVVSLLLTHKANTDAVDYVWRMVITLKDLEVIILFERSNAHRCTWPSLTIAEILCLSSSHMEQASKRRIKYVEQCSVHFQAIENITIRNVFLCDFTIYSFCSLDTGWMYTALLSVSWRISRGSGFASFTQSQHRGV